MFLDATLVGTDRISIPGRPRGVDLWWSGRHVHHGGNIQVVSPPMAGRRGPPRYARAASTTPALPARPRPARSDPARVDDGRPGPADPGHEGQADLLRIPI